MKRKFDRRAVLVRIVELISDSRPGMPAGNGVTTRPPHASGRRQAQAVSVARAVSLDPAGPDPAALEPAAPDPAAPHPAAPAPAAPVSAGPASAGPGSPASAAGPALPASRLSASPLSG